MEKNSARPLPTESTFDQEDLHTTNPLKTAEYDHRTAQAEVRRWIDAGLTNAEVIEIIESRLGGFYL